MGTFLFDPSQLRTTAPGGAPNAPEVSFDPSELRTFKPQTRAEMEASAPGVPSPAVPKELQGPPPVDRSKPVKGDEDDWSNKVERALYSGDLASLVPAAKASVRKPITADSTPEEIENEAAHGARDQLDQIGRGVARFAANLATVKNSAITAATMGLGAALPALANAPAIAEALKDAPAVLKALDVASRAAVPAAAAGVGAVNLAQQGKPKNLEDATEAALNALMVGAGVAGAIHAGKTVLGNYPETPTASAKVPGSSEVIPAEQVGGIPAVNPQQAAATAEALGSQGQRLAAQYWKNLNVSAPTEIATDAGKVFLQPFDPKAKTPYHEVLDAQGNRVVGGTAKTVGDWLRTHTERVPTGESTSSIVVNGPEGPLQTEISKPRIAAVQQSQAAEIGAPPAESSATPAGPAFEARTITPKDVTLGSVFQDKAGRKFTITAVAPTGEVKFTDEQGRERANSADRFAQRMVAVAPAPGKEQEFAPEQLSPNPPASTVRSDQQNQQPVAQEAAENVQQPAAQSVPQASITPGPLPAVPVSQQGTGNALHIDKLVAAAGETNQPAVAPQPAATETNQPVTETTPAPADTVQAQGSASGIKAGDPIRYVGPSQQADGFHVVEYGKGETVSLPTRDIRTLFGEVPSSSKSLPESEPIPHEVLGHQQFPWQQTAAEFAATNETKDLDQHRAEVKDAIARGEAVPANVLAEYPDLQPGGKTAEGKSEKSPTVKEGDEVTFQKNGQSVTGTVTDIGTGDDGNPVARIRSGGKKVGGVPIGRVDRVPVSALAGKSTRAPRNETSSSWSGAPEPDWFRDSGMSHWVAVRDSYVARDASDPSFRQMMRDYVEDWKDNRGGAHWDRQAFEGLSTKVEEPHKFSSTQVNLPPELHKAFTDGAAGIPDSDLSPEGREAEPHVTALYGLHAEEPSDVKKVLKGEGPITATIGKVSVFKGEDQDVVKLDVDSPDLHRLNGKLAALPNSNSHPTYQPHITLAYVKSGEGEKYAGKSVPGLTGKTVTFDALTFSAKDRSKTDIPLSGPSTQVAEPSTPVEEETNSVSPITAGDFREQSATLGQLIKAIETYPPSDQNANSAAVHGIEQAQTLLDSGALPQIDPEYQALKRVVDRLQQWLRNEVDVTDLRAKAIESDHFLQKIRAAVAAGESDDADISQFQGRDVIRKAYTAGTPQYRKAVNHELRVLAGSPIKDTTEDANGILHYAGKYDTALMDLDDIDPPEFDRASYDAARFLREDAYEALAQNEPLLVSQDNPQGETPSDPQINAEESEQDANRPPDTPAVSLAKTVYKLLRANVPLGNVTQLHKLAEKEFGAGRTEGTWTPKDAFDSMEAGVNMYLMHIGPALMQQPVLSGLSALRGLMARITSQGSVRTEDQVKNQQFSTPPTEAYIAARVANMKPGDVMLEPSGGNGGLAVFGNAAGATVHVNELSPRRREMLEAVGFSSPTGVDAEYINATLDPSIQPTVVLMNPPFSASTTKSHEAKNSNKYGFNHVTSALQRLRPGGRLVAILGGGQANEPEGGASLKGGMSGKWFEQIAKTPGSGSTSPTYNIRANVRVNGKEYAKYGTSFATRIIVIDKVPGFKSWADVVTGNVDTLEQAWDLLKGVAASRPEIKEQVRPGAGSKTGSRKNQPGVGENSGGVADQQGVGAKSEAGAQAPAGNELGAAAGHPGSTGSRGPGQSGETGERTDVHQPEVESPENPATAAAQNLDGSAPNAADQRPVGDAAGAEGLAGLSGLSLEEIIDAATANLAGTLGKTPEKPAEAPRPKKQAPKTPKKVAAPAPTSAPKPTNPLSSAADKARQRLRDKMRGTQLQAGIDPQDLIDLATIGGEHIVNGAIQFKDWSMRVMTDVGDLIKWVAEQSNQTTPVVLRQVYAIASQVAARFGAKAEPAPAEEPLTGEDTAVAEAPVTAAQQSDEGEQEDTAAYVKYKPSISGAKHPADIVETKTMSTVSLPPITYKPSLPAESLKVVSAVQMEAVALAGQANDEVLPDGSRSALLCGDGTGVGKGLTSASILFDNWNKGRRRLMWVSEKWDLMQDAARDFEMLQAKDLMQGTKRETSGKFTFSKTGRLKALKDWNGAAKIEHDGVIFVTYALLRSENKNGTRRAAQIEQWLRGEDEADGGYMLFDESHNLKNAVVGQGAAASKTGVAVVNLLGNLPKLRTTSLSATAATEVMNLGYLSRLGLWGPGTAFPNGFNQFATEIGSGKTAAMEMIARELKSAGKYIARTLSFKGVTYREREAVLTDAQKDIYKTASKAWQSVFDKAESTIATTTNGGNLARSRFLAQFYATQLRFFGVLLTTLKIPAAIEEAQKGIADGKAVLVTLVNTNEAAQNRQKNRATDEDDDEDQEYDFGPKEMLTNLVKENYPTQQWVDDVDSNGNPIKKPLYTVDAEGREIPVQNPEAVRERDELIAQIDRDLHLPSNPLDILVDGLGGVEKVAELTGRKERFDEATRKFVSRGGPGVPKDQVNISEMNKFQSGKKIIAVLSSAAGTGISLHAGNNVENKRQRLHITLQFGWSADKQMQMFGRSHRTNQASAPEYVMMVSDLGGEKRFVSTIAKRLGTLGAITKGQSNAATGTDLMEKVNFESDEGQKAANAFYSSLLKNVTIPGAYETVTDDALSEDAQAAGAPAGTRVKWLNPADGTTVYGKATEAIRPAGQYQRVNVTLDDGKETDYYRGSLVMVGPERQVQREMTGMQILHDLRILKGTPPSVPLADRTNVTRLLNRILALSPDVQNPVYNYFYDIFQATVQSAIDDGTLDTGVKQLPGDSFKIEEQRGVSTDPKTGAKTIYSPVDAKVRMKRYSSANLRRDIEIGRKQDKPVSIWKDDKGKLIARETANPVVHADGKIDPASWVYRPGSSIPRKSADKDLHKYVSIVDAASRGVTEIEKKLASAESDVRRYEGRLSAQSNRGYAPDSWIAESVKRSQDEVSELEVHLARAKKLAEDPETPALDEWEKQYQDSPDHTVVRHHLIGGSVLRWWNAIREASPFLDIYTAVDSKTNQRVVGVDIPEFAIGRLISRISGGKSTVNAAQLIADVARNNLRYALEGGIQVQRGRVSGNTVLQFVPSTPEAAKTLKDLGVSFETGLRPIYYVGSGANAEKIVKAVLDQFPVTQQSSEENAGAESPQRMDPRAGSAPMLVDLIGWLDKQFGKKVKDVNYSAFGGGGGQDEEPELKNHYNKLASLKSVFGTGTGLSEVRLASPQAWSALVQMASSDTVTRTTMRRALLHINGALEHASVKFPDLISYYSESRMRGIRDRWEDFASQAVSMSDEQLEESYSDAFADLLGAIESKRGIPQNIRQSVEALATRKDWETMRDLIAQTFSDAADLVATIMEPEEFNRIKDLVAHDDNVAKADRIYSDTIESLMSDYHSQHEGVMATALGPANRYVPLTGVAPEEKGKRGGKFLGIRRPFKKPRNERNLMATGISSRGYDTSLEALEKGLIGAVRNSSKYQAISAMEDAGLLKRYTKNAPEYFRFQGEYYPAKRIEISPPRQMLISENGATRAVQLPAQMAVTAPWVYKEVKPILESEHLDDSLIQRIMDPANAAAIFGPTLAIIDSHNILSTLTANTPFLGSSLAEKAASAPLLKRFSAAVMLARQVEPLNEEALDDLTHMAKIGTLPAKYGAKTWSKRIAELSGAQQARWWDSTPFLYGPAGIDVRARLKMYRIAKALNPDISDIELHDFINQIGTYIPGLQSDVERFVKKSGLAPFFTRGAQMLVNGIHAWTGTGPMPKRTLGLWIAQAITGGAIALVALWLTISKTLGWKPVGLLKSALTHDQIPGSVRQSKIGKQMGWNKPGTMVVDFSMWNPTVSRGARATGIMGAIDTMMAGGKGWQGAEYGASQAASTFLQPAIGPLPRAVLVGVFGVQPYLTGMRDRRGSLGPQFFPAVPPRHAGLKSFAERGVAAVFGENAMWSQAGQAAGFMTPDENDPGGRYLRMIGDLALPGANPKPMNLYSKQQMLYQQRTGTK